MMTPAAEAIFLNLNEYDKKQVAKEIKQIVYFPNGNNVSRDLRGLSRMWKTLYPFNGYHFLIKFETHTGGLVIKDIYFDNELIGIKTDINQERNVMYEIKRSNKPASFTKDFGNKIVDELTAGWDSSEAKPVHRIETRHAAVNGMNNNLTDAAWVMGTHVDVAHQNENVDKYTLFHNPSNGFGEDILECGWDKRWLNPIGLKGYSSNVQHLSAVLDQTQQRGHKTDWTVHSQGAIIFARAVREHMRKRGGALSCHTVSLHGIGCNEKDAIKVCQQAGIFINNIRNNDFDPVPNLAGANNLSGGLARAMGFAGLLTNTLASPHSLPFLGLEVYEKQLRMAGKEELAKKVNNYRTAKGLS
ncbi:hypothetical protein [Psychromonas antarctica]|uniref:hypothetical protein n=1 Tax=Psychromonas antarctica TaxID=67573 RepID=UPI001EE8E949|nr:hypothetical protein [Psychromonas antarctica]MCG6201792.1 hypothetical protein [Psychromonas antarctica]